MTRSIINDKAFSDKGYLISTDKALIDVEKVYSYLENESYWAKGVTLSRLENAIQNSICFGVYQGQELVGFARVVTDIATFAYLCDVFILEEHRRLGLSKWLIQSIVNHPDLQDLRRWSLATSDAHKLYSQFGFVPLSKPGNWMEIFKPYTQST